MNHQNSEKIDDLPVMQQKMNPTEYAKLAPLIHETKKNIKLKRSLKKYLLSGLLFIILNISVFDKIILGILPSLQSFSYVVIIIKAVLFIISLYILDNMIKD